MNAPRAPRPASCNVNARGGRFVVDVSVPDASSPKGRRVYRPSFATKAEAEALAVSVRARLKAGLAPFEEPAAAARVVTVLDVLLRYPKTPRGEQHIAAIRKTALASKAAEAIDLPDLEGYLAERGNLPTCSKDFSFLKRALALAKAHGIIRSHYFEKLVGDKVTRRRLMPAYRIAESNGREVSAADFEAIVAKLNPAALRAVRFARSTGCRKGEVASLDWRMLEPGKGFRPIVQKGSSPRVVAYDPTILGPRGIGLVFAELGSTPAAIYQRLTAAWRYAVKAAKVAPYRFHDLRHTFGTVLRREGRTFSDIAAIMGITELMAHVYAHEDREALQIEAARRKGLA